MEQPSAKYLTAHLSQSTINDSFTIVVVAFCLYQLRVLPYVAKTVPAKNRRTAFLLQSIAVRTYEQAAGSIWSFRARSKSMPYPASLPT
jgi:hypothetical protein